MGWTKSTCVFSGLMDDVSVTFAMGTRKNALVTLLAALLAIAGCASSADTPEDDETSDGSGGGDGDGDGVGPTDDNVEVAPENVIDDLEDKDDAIKDSEDRSGSWYTFHDDTKGGTQMPGDDFKPTAGGANGSKYAAVTSGKGFTEWGAGMAFDLNYGGEDLKGKPKPTWDASKLKGVTFMMKSKTPKVRFAIATQAVADNGDGGGTCVDNTTMDNCNNTHGVDLTVGTDWERYKIPFTMLKQEEGWGKVVAFDATKLLGFEFSVPELASSVEFELAVDDIAFY
jgi:hypothetical protein